LFSYKEALPSKEVIPNRPRKDPRTTHAARGLDPIELLQKENEAISGLVIPYFAHKQPTRSYPLFVNYHKTNTLMGCFPNKREPLNGTTAFQISF